MNDHWWLIKDSIACSRIPKNGSTSVTNALRTHQAVSNADVLWCQTRVFWMRDPIARFHSAYSFFSALNDRNENNGGPYGTAPNSIITSDYHAFVDYALENPNAHWFPQTGLLQNSWTNIHRFEEIMSLWNNYWPGFLPWHNGVALKNDIDTYRLGDIQDYYQEDLHVYNTIV